MWFLANARPRNSVLLLGTRPQAVCFCRDTLNHPCTYVNTEHQDTHSAQWAEPLHYRHFSPHPLPPCNFLSWVNVIQFDLWQYKSHICINSSIPPSYVSVNSLQLFPERPMNSLVSAFQRYVFKSSIFWCSVLLGNGLRFHLSKFRSSCSRGWCSASSSCSSSSSWPCLRMTLWGWWKEEKKPSPHMFSAAPSCLYTFQWHVSTKCAWR